MQKLNSMKFSCTPREEGMDFVWQGTCRGHLESYWYLFIFSCLGQRLNRYLIYSSLNYTFMLYVLFCTFVIFQIKELLKMTARWFLVQKKERDKKRSLPLLVTTQDWLSPGFFFQWCDLGVTEISEGKTESGFCWEGNRTVGYFLDTLFNLQGEHTGYRPSNTTP